MNPMTSLSALSANMGAFGIIATILAIIATVAAFILVVPESKREKLGRFGKFLHDAVNFKFLIVEKILQALYIFVTAYVILCGFFMLFMAPETWTGRHWLGGYGILLMVLVYVVMAACAYLQANLMAQLAQKGCKVFLVGGLLRPETEAIIGAAALHSLQQYNFTKAFLGANGVALDAGFTTPDPEEAAVKAAVVRRAREAWFLVDDSKFACIYPAVIAELSGGAILTNHCPNPKYRQFTLVKEAAE